MTNLRPTARSEDTAINYTYMSEAGQDFQEESSMLTWLNFLFFIYLEDFCHLFVKFELRFV